MTHYIVQFKKEDVPNIGLEKIDRLDINGLLDCFVYPVVWSYDNYIHAWLPCEIEDQFAKWLGTGFNKIDTANSDNFSQKHQYELKRSGILSPHERIPVTQLFARRRKDKLVKIPQLLSKDYVSWLRDFFNRISKDMVRWPDMYGISRTSTNDHPLMRLIHSQLLNFIQEIVARPLKPSYTFTATYDNQSNLPRHTDRPQCVWNVSLLFGSTPEEIPLSTWPLFVEVGNTTHKLELEAGDGGLYSGIKHPHWRDRMPNNLKTVTGAFLHYVESDFQGDLK